MKGYNFFEHIYSVVTLSATRSISLIFKLPLMVWEMGYRHLYLRRYEAIPAWELNLLAVK